MKRGCLTCASFSLFILVPFAIHRRWLGMVCRLITLEMKSERAVPSKLTSTSTAQGLPSLSPGRNVILRPHSNVAGVEKALTSKDDQTGLNFKAVLLVSMHAYFHATEVISAYQKVFWDVVYVVPKDPESFENTGVAFDTCDDDAGPDIGKWDMKSYPCIARIFGHLSGIRPLRRPPAWDQLLRQDGRGEHLQGILALHSDFWITPAFLTGRNYKKVWMIRANADIGGKGNMGPEVGDWFNRCCFSEAILKRNGYVYSNGDYIGWPAPHGPPQWGPRKEALAELKHAGHVVPNPARFCVGWTDAYYLPKGAWPLYQEVVSVLARHRIMNEIAIPIGLQVINRSGCGGAGCEFDLLENCFGSCCRKSRTPDDMRKFPCGHKFDVRRPDFRRSLTYLWMSSVETIERYGNK